MRGGHRVSVLHIPRQHTNTYARTKGQQRVAEYHRKRQRFLRAEILQSPGGTRSGLRPSRRARPLGAKNGVVYEKTERECPLRRFFMIKICASRGADWLRKMQRLNNEPHPKRWLRFSVSRNGKVTRDIFVYRWPRLCFGNSSVGDAGDLIWELCAWVCTARSSVYDDRLSGSGDVILEKPRKE